MRVAERLMWSWEQSELGITQGCSGALQVNKQMFVAVSSLKGALRASWGCSLDLHSRKEEGMAGQEPCAGKPRLASCVPARCPTIFLEHCIRFMKRQGRERRSLIRFGSNKVDFAAVLPLMTFILTNPVYRYFQSVNFFLKYQNICSYFLFFLLRGNELPGVI